MEELEVLFKRRRHPRAGLRIPVSYASENQTRSTLTLDLGGGGLRLLAHEFVPVRTRLRLEFSLGQATEPIVAVGRTVWVQRIPYGEQYQVGVEFLEIADARRQAVMHRVLPGGARVAPEALAEVRLPASNRQPAASQPVF